MNTQAALKYYHLWNKTGIYNAVYLFGDESRTEVENSLGGPGQQNAPHFIELYAALAAVDFFEKEFDTNQDAQYFMIARRQNNRLEWADLPDGDNGSIVQSKVGQLARFAFAYLSVYRPMLQEIYNTGTGYRAPWFVDFFEQNQSTEDQTLLDAVKDYCQDFLLWLANIQNSGEYGTTELVKYDAYAQRGEDKRLALKPVENFTLQTFSNLTRPQREAEPNALNEVWKRMCNSRRRERDVQGVGRFLKTLYENCEE